MTSERSTPYRRPAWWRTALAIAYLVPVTLVLGSTAVLFSWVPPRGNLMVVLARVWSRGLLWISGVKVEAEVPASVDGRRGRVYLANHQSYFDIPALLVTLPGSLRFAAKRSLFRIPVFGWSLHAGGFIPVDRSDRSRAREVYKIAGRRLDAGASVLFFPEGTRSRDGRIGPFERGGFLVALKAGAPIVPVGVSGTRRVLSRDSLKLASGTVQVRLGEPIDSKQFGIRRRDALMSRVRSEVVELSGEEDGAEAEVPSSASEELTPVLGAPSED
ncbi:MAG: lysophospholipid acyltransferase family protein [Acidobacteriota bacterium]